MKTPIYMDYQATTPVDPRVLEEMLPSFGARFGNASSGHSFGWEAAAAVKVARERCAAAIGANPDEIVFTSGSTEAINVALKGTFEQHGHRGHLITAATEHPAVLDVAEWLEGRGVDLTILGVDERGRIDLDELRSAIRPETRLVALMAANNEIGTRHPLREIGAICREQGVPLFSDATQGVGKLPIDVSSDPIDLLCCSAHKMYGPKGAGFLYVRSHAPRVTVAKQTHGGGQERSMRAGTLNVPGIVGLGKACQLAVEELESESARLVELRELLFRTISSQLQFVHRNGDPDFGLPGNLNLSFEYVDGEALLMDLRDLAVSSGSACSTGSPKPSHVLVALGRESSLAQSSLRFGLGRMTTQLEVEYAGEAVVAAVKRLRDLSPMYELACDSRRAEEGS